MNLLYCNNTLVYCLCLASLVCLIHVYLRIEISTVTKNKIHFSFQVRVEFASKKWSSGTFLCSLLSHTSAILPETLVMAGDRNEGVGPNKQRATLEEFVDRPKKGGVYERKHVRIKCLGKKFLEC